MCCVCCIGCRPGGWKAAEEEYSEGSIERGLGSGEEDEDEVDGVGELAELEALLNSGLDAEEAGPLTDAVEGAASHLCR